MDTGTTVSVDVAAIVLGVAAIISALTPIVLLLLKRLEGIHTLVNDQFTQEKARRLDDLKTQKLLVERLMGDDVSGRDREVLLRMRHDIEQLTKEVDKRDESAARVKFPGGR